MSSKSDAPDVVERGPYTEIGDGPPEDTFAYMTATPMAASRTPTYVVYDDPQKEASQPSLDRTKLARQQPSPAEPVRPSGIPRKVQVLIFVVVVVLVATAGVVSTVFRNPPVVEVPEAPAEPEVPATHDGVPVEKGLKRKALPPKKK